MRFLKFSARKIWEVWVGLSLLVLLIFAAILEWAVIEIKWPAARSGVDAYLGFLDEVLEKLEN